MKYYGIIFIIFFLFITCLAIITGRFIRKKKKKQTIEPNHLKDAIQNEDFLHNLNNILDRKTKQQPKKFSLLRKKWLKRKKFLRMQGMSRNLNHKKQK